MSSRIPSPLEIVQRVLGASGAPPATGDAIDVGAHTGSFTDELLRSGLFTSVTAFEPNPENAAALSALALHDTRLTVVRAALGDRAGAGELHCDGDKATGSLLAYREGYATHGLVQRVPVPVMTLDDYRAGSGRSAVPVRLIKIDTQGYDFAVIRGASRLLASDRPVVIAEMIYVPMYVGQAEPDATVMLMRASGYMLYTLFNIHVTAEGRIAYADALFVPLEHDIPQSQRYVQIDSHTSYLSQIATLERICRERLDVINVLDAEVKRRAALNGTSA